MLFSWDLYCCKKDQSNYYKRKPAYRFRDLLLYKSGVRHQSMLADMILQKQLKVYCLDQQEEEQSDTLTLGLSSFSESSKLTPSDTLSPIRSHLPKVPLPVNLWGPFSLKQPQNRFSFYMGHWEGDVCPLHLPQRKNFHNSFHLIFSLSYRNTVFNVFRSNKMSFVYNENNII